jgi:ABC-type glycerol-3-phosphate transport system permease component
VTTVAETIEMKSRKRPRLHFHFSFKYLLIYLILGSYALFTIFAFGWIISVSLKTNVEFFSKPPWSLPLIPQFQNYVTAWNRGMGTMFKNSILVATLGGGLSVGISTLAAYAIARIPFKFNQAMLTFFLLGMMIPYMLTSIPLYYLVSQLQHQFMTIDSRIILIILYMVSGFPFNTFVMTATFKTLPSELDEAATMDGASPLRVFLQVMLPLSRPGLATTFIINFLSLWNEFYWAMIFTKNKAAYTISLGIVMLDQQAVYTAKWTDLFAGAVINVLPVLIVFALLQNQVTKGMTAGAIKG